MSSTGLGRRTSLMTLVGSLVVALACAMVFVGVAEGARKSSKKRNWPNTPVRHTLNQRVGDSTPSFSANLRGDVAVAGNTPETCPENIAQTHRRGAKRRPRARTSAEACLGLDNNEHNMVYVNVDPGAGRFNSSTATLTVPAGARVVRAYLYWAGDLSAGVNRPPNGADNEAPAGNSPQTNPLYTTALLRAGSGGSYATIDATAPGRNGRWDYIQSWYQHPGNSEGWAYQVRARRHRRAERRLGDWGAKDAGRRRVASGNRRRRAGGDRLQPLTPAGI